MPGKEIAPFTGAGEAVPSLRSLRHSALVSSGMLIERKKYGSAEERKLARKARAKSRREERRSYLEGLDLAPQKRVKITKEKRKAKAREKSKGLRRLRNIYLQEHPEAAKKLGIDVRRLRV